MTAYKRGKRGEDIATWWLRLHGYRILARRMRTPVGEIDILARRGARVCVVEVKRRTSLHKASYALTQKQCMRLARAYMWWLRGHAQWQSTPVRFDAILISPFRLRHIKNISFRGEP